jgi:carboxyl-terminal processing protease
MTKKIDDETKNKIDKLSKQIGKVNKEEIKIIKKKKTTKPTFKTIEVIILIILTAAISLIVGGAVSYKLISQKEVYSKADKELQEFLKTYEEINNNYYEDVDKTTLIEGAINGMLGTLDDYSTYMSESSSNNFNIQLEGSYNGLGIEIFNNDDGNIEIADVIDDSPASNANLKAGDVLVKYNDKSIEDTNISDFTSMVKENNSQKFTLTYIRNNKKHTISISKENITLKSVVSKTYDDDQIGYLYVSIFANNTYKQFKQELEKLEAKNIKTLIIDLRSNSGGHLESADNMISLFLDKTHPIYQIKSKSKTTKYYSSGKETKKYKIIVLTNGASASASEIMASALKEQYGATLVGVKTYGKGTVQELQTLNSGAQFKLTTKTWLTSKGNKVDGKGVDVDVSVALSDEYSENPSDETDNQLQAALKEARK